MRRSTPVLDAGRASAVAKEAVLSGVTTTHPGARPPCNPLLLSPPRRPKRDWVISPPKVCPPQWGNQLAGMDVGWNQHSTAYAPAGNPSTVSSPGPVRSMRRSTYVLCMDTYEVLPVGASGRVRYDSFILFVLRPRCPALSLWLSPSMHKGVCDAAASSESQSQEPAHGMTLRCLHRRSSIWHSLPSAIPRCSNKLGPE